MSSCNFSSIVVIVLPVLVSRLEIDVCQSDKLSKKNIDDEDVCGIPTKSYFFQLEKTIKKE